MTATDHHASEEALRRALTAVKDLKGRVARYERAASEPIAVIGAGCRFPGGANSPHAFWELLRAGREAIGPIPASRWNHQDYFDPDPDQPGKIYTDRGGFLDESVDQFDASFFGIAPIEARSVDPQHRLLLEVVWEALEHAGIAPDSLTGSRTGVFVGLGTADYSNLQMRSTDPATIGRYYGSGSAFSIAAGRISYVLGLRGPTMALDTACSSSLVATALAMQSLRTGACRMAIAGGVNLILEPQPMVFLSRFRALSPTGKCHTFGAEADGYVRAEGGGAIVLKRLSDAEADGDRVLAVLRGAAVNHDGRSSGLTVPSGSAQREVLELALADAQLHPGDVDLIEAHGTGTELGDPIEVRAIDAVYSPDRSMSAPLIVGSVKTNLGHLEAAAGIAGLLKVVLAMEHDEIPPHLLEGELSPHIDWAAMPIAVGRELRPWPRSDRPRRAAVSAFGLSGTNAHVIVEEAPRRAPRTDHETRPVVLTLSARDDVALGELAQNTAKLLPRTAGIADAAWTSQVGRAQLTHRLAVTASSTEDAAMQLYGWTPETRFTGVSHRASSPGPPPLAFVFTGQGAQRPGMGQALYEHEPVFRAVMDDCDRIMRLELPVPLLDVLYGADGSDAGLIHQTQYTQPAMFAFQCALAALWRSWGVEPAAVAGHSIGEYAAAVVAGVMDLDAAAQLITNRGRLMGALPAGGSMVALFADEERVAALIAPYRDRVSIAACNGPASLVISGAGDAIDAIVAGLAQGVTHRRLQVSHAFHSPLMAPMVTTFAAYADAVSYRTPTVPFISSVTGTAESAAVAEPGYWRDHVLATVRFDATVAALGKTGIEHFLEIGPQATLLGMMAPVVGPDAGLYASLRPHGERDERSQLADAVGGLWAAGVEVDWRAIDRGRSEKVDLPTYPFQRRRYWLDEPTTAPAARRTRSDSVLHPLVHERVESPAIVGRAYQSELSAGDPVFFADHRVFGAPLMPATGLLEMALASARDAFGVQAALSNIVLREMLVLPEHEPLRLQVVLGEVSAGTASFSVHSVRDGRWTTHASGVVELAPVPRRDEAEPLPDERTPFEATDLYQRLTSRGVEYGPSFRTVSAIERGPWWATGQSSLSASDAATSGSYLMHPALLDGCLQLLEAALLEQGSDDVFLPVGIGSYRVDAPGVSAVRATARVAPQTGRIEMLSADIELHDLDGAPVAALLGLKLRRANRRVVAEQARLALGMAAQNDELYELNWVRLLALAPAPSEPGDWLVIGGDSAADATAAALVGRGHRVSSIGDVADGADQREWSGVVLATGLAATAGDDIVGGQRRPLGSLLALVQKVLAKEVRLAPDARLWVLTRNAQSVNLQADPVDVTRGSLWGMANALAVEEPNLGVVCVDLAPRGTDGDDAALIVDELLGGSDEDRVAFRSGRRFGLRLGRVRQDAVLAVPDGAYALAITERGTLDGIVLEPVDVVTPAPGEVVLEVRASGLNFRDVLNVMGMYPGAAGDPGSECSGVVTAVGEGVESVAVGDEVIALVDGSFRRYATTKAQLVFPLPRGLGFAAGASTPIAYLTAQYGLRQLADVQPGDVVLVHAAAGGVGMAAVQIAHRAGATVIGTAGSDEKRSLLRSLGVEHVLDSRSLAFAPAVLEITGGRGVDVALNSLADDFIAATFGVVAEHGTFLELGKRGIWSAEQVASTHPTVRYHAYDLTDVVQEQPALLRSMMADILGALTSSELQPLPHRCFPIQDVRVAFRHMAMARHVGKIVVTQGRAATAGVIAAGPTLDGDGAYLITGGLGGLGLQAAASLAARGARHIALLGRGAPSEEASVAITALRDAGVDVAVFAGDVTDGARVVEVVAGIDSTMGPLRGVIHAAGVLDDATVRNLDWSRFETVLRPKVGGAWNLHVATLGERLDFFVMYSSAAALLGSSGQTNYAAANAFLDALAHHRQAIGLPALSIDWGAWGEVGMAAGLDEMQRARISESGVRLIDPSMGDQILGELLGSSAAQVGVVPIDWRLVAERQSGRRRPLLEALLSASAAPSVGQATDQTFIDELSALDDDDRYDFVRDHVRAAIVAVLGLDDTSVLDSGQGLPDLGMDSLMAVELGNRLQRSTGLALDSTVAFEWPTLEALSRHLAHDLLGVPAKASAGGHRELQAVAEQEAAERAAEVEAITELEAEAFLIEELRRSGY